MFDETGRRLAANDSRVRWADFDAAFECVGGAFRAQVQAGELQERLREAAAEADAQRRAAEKLQEELDVAQAAAQAAAAAPETAAVQG